VTRFILRDETIRHNALDAVCEATLDPLVEVIVQPYVPEGTSAQKRTYFGWRDEMSDYTGYSKQEMHDMLMATLTDEVRVEPKQGMTGFNRRKSINELSKVELIDFMRDVQIFASQTLGITLRDPDPLMGA